MRTQRHPTKPWARIPKPSKATRNAWAKIDDRKPPEGKADGDFDTFITWCNKAPSWIGGTGAFCFDTLDRPCRMGKDFMRARDEGTFPVRYYMPERYQEPSAA